MIAIAASVLMLVACGGDDGPGSGIDPDRTIESLNTEEARSVCEDAVAAQGGEGTIVDCDGISIMVQSVEECTTSVAAATCTNTIAELDDCIAAMEEDPCAVISGPECSFLLSCASGGDDS